MTPTFCFVSVGNLKIWKESVVEPRIFQEERIHMKVDIFLWTYKAVLLFCIIWQENVGYLCGFREDSARQSHILVFVTLCSQLRCPPLSLFMRYNSEEKTVFQPSGKVNMTYEILNSGRWKYTVENNKSKYFTKDFLHFSELGSYCIAACQVKIQKL